MFERLVFEYLRQRPSEATMAGVHDFDDEVGDLTADGFAQRDEFARRALSEVEALGHDAPLDDTLDAAILRSTFEVQRRDHAENEPHKHDPSLYCNAAIGAVYSLIARAASPADFPWPSIEARLNKIPTLVAAGHANLERAPAIWVDIAMRETEGAIAFLDDIVGPKTEESASLRRALDVARLSLEDYRNFLRDKLGPRDGMPFACGKDFFEFKLRREHLLPYDAASLRAVGEEAVRSTQAQLEELAHRIDPHHQWQELVARYSADHPEPDELLDVYRSDTASAKRFVADKNLVSVLDDDRLSIVPTPKFLAPTMPYAAYQPPGAFEPARPGLYYVTPPDPSWTPPERAAAMLGHNRYAILNITVHEAYPGHHLQLTHANRVDSAVRRFFWNSVFAEGWALYCEQLALDEGLTDDPVMRLFQLKDQLWRACRIVIDVDLHTGAMTFDQAVDMLVDVAAVERPNARGEVRRYTQSPTQPMGYLVGKLQIQSLRERARAALGPKFELRKFHDRLLSFGTIPVALVEPLMLSTAAA